MFTGLIEEIGSVRKIVQTGMGMKLTIECNKVLEGTQLGDSIAVNGVCLTVTQMDSDYFVADVMPETMKRTNLGTLQPHTPVNLERAVAAGQRMGGHFVQGHIDGVGRLEERRPNENAVIFRFSVAESFTRYMVDKGSIAVNGISLTIVDVGINFFTVSLIPHTLKYTQLQYAKPGDLVNIECDMIGKYIYKMVRNSSAPTVTLEKLKEAGFA